jgi:nucleotide-binding universal stress UspA family protein
MQGGNVMFKGCVLVATDGSDLSDRAVQTAAELAARTGSRLVAVTVAAPYPYTAVGESSAIAGADYQATVGAEASDRLARAKATAAHAGVECATSLQESGDVFRGILMAAEQHAAGLIVMASHGHRGLASLVLGSETQKLLAHTALPVLVVR